MGKFLLGLATGLVLVFLTVVLLFFAALRFRDKPPAIADHSVLVLRLAERDPRKATGRTSRHRRRPGPRTYRRRGLDDPAESCRR